MSSINPYKYFAIKLQRQVANLTTKIDELESQNIQLKDALADTIYLACNSGCGCYSCSCCNIDKYKQLIKEDKYGLE